MSQLLDTLPCAAAFTPSSEEDAFFASIPGKWCVALLVDAEDRPLQLVCAKNLRAMLRRRLGVPEMPDESPAPQPTKRVDYRELVRSIRWCRVDSEFEMDLVYIEAARLAFPAHWRRLIPERTAHFVRIDLDHPHPDFTRETGVDAGPGRLFGPFTDRAKADRWIESIRDVFDLCRYRNILAQSPNGRACAYKQMNKCPAPCDGTIALDVYRAGVRQAVDDVTSPAALLERLAGEMKQHAAALEFEKAGKVKSRLTTIEGLHAGPFASVRPIESFHFVSVQPGGRKGTAKVFLIKANGVDEVLGIRDAKTSIDDVRDVLRSSAAVTSAWPSEVLLGTVCHYLAGARSSARFVPLHRFDAAALAERLNDAMKVDASKAKAGASADDAAEPVRETRLQI